MSKPDWLQVSADVRRQRAADQVEKIDHPDHYGGADNPYEAIKVIEAMGFGFCLGNCVKYLWRLGKKVGSDELEDALKARWYLERHIQNLSNSSS